MGRDPAEGSAERARASGAGTLRAGKYILLRTLAGEDEGGHLDPKASRG